MVAPFVVSLPPAILSGPFLPFYIMMIPQITVAIYRYLWPALIIGPSIYAVVSAYWAGRRNYMIYSFLIGAVSVLISNYIYPIPQVGKDIIILYSVGGGLAGLICLIIARKMESGAEKGVSGQ